MILQRWAVLLQPCILPSKVPLMERTPHQNNLISPSPTKLQQQRQKKKKKKIRFFPLINKESQVPQHKNTHVQSANFCHQSGTFLTVSLIQSPVLRSERPCRGQPPPCWEPASKQVSTIENHMEVLGGGLRCWGQRREVVPTYPSFPKPNGEWRRRG